MKTKRIEAVIAPRESHWVGDGFKVNNFIPGAVSMKQMDPFILLDYNAERRVPASNHPMGVGVHPHRGFETVTIAYQGKVEHHDSAGGGGVIGTGDVQWMTAARGVLHKEFHEKEWSRTGGLFHMVQLWVNLPAKDKMSAPAYQAIENVSMPRIAVSEGEGFVELIAGEYQGTIGPAHTHSPIFLANAKLKRGGIATFNHPNHYNVALMVVEGEVAVNGQIAPVNHFVKLANEGETYSIEAVTPTATVLVMAGEPLNEPIVAYGPFVMNTKAEIAQAFEDFNQGKFGYLED